MANFWDLPKAVRMKIYRLHLLKKEPISYESVQYHSGCDLRELQLPVRLDSKKRRLEPKIMPKLLQAARKIDHEAAHIYFGENAFELWSPCEIDSWTKRLWRRHLDMIQSVVVIFWEDAPTKISASMAARYDPGYDNAFRKIGGLKSLKSLTILVDEKTLLSNVIEASPTIEWHNSLGYGPQINMKVLHFSGMTSIRSMRGLYHFEILPPDSCGNQLEQGPLDGGLLETTIKRDVMLPRSEKSYDRTGHFRFLDLPAEVRNMIYDLLLVFSGPTYPISGPPTSVTSQYRQLRKKADRAALPVPLSALEVLCTNHQIHTEAKKIFYHDNDLVFSASLDLLSFLYTLGSVRSDSLRSVTLFYIDGRSMTTFDPSLDSDLKNALLAIRSLPGLRKFHLLFEKEQRDRHPLDQENPADLPYRIYPAYLPCAEGLFKLRNLTDIACRHLPAEDWKKNPRSRTEPGKDMFAAYKHFTHGLQLAQKGSVNSQLYTKRKWHQDVLWPILDGSDCGIGKGCTCGKKEDATD